MPQRTYKTVLRTNTNGNKMIAAVLICFFIQAVYLTLALFRLFFLYPARRKRLKRNFRYVRAVPLCFKRRRYGRKS